MSPSDTPFSFVILGEQSLLIQCTEALLARGHRLLAVVSEDPRIIAWCRERDLPRFGDFFELRELDLFDFLFSATNLKLLPEWLLAKPRRLSINFHDGPLPRYAGVNAPVWALINGETEYGIAWHEMTAKADSGSILVARNFPIVSDETALSLNAKCYQHGLEAFEELIELLETDGLRPQMMDIAARSWYGASKKPHAGGLLDWTQPGQKLDRLIRALDFGTYPNPVAMAKADLGGRVVLVRRAELVIAGSHGSPGEIVSIDPDSLTVRCAEQALRIVRLTDLQGDPLDVRNTLQSMGLEIGSHLPLLASEKATAIDETLAALARHEGFWMRRLQSLDAADLPFPQHAGKPDDRLWREIELRREGDPKTTIGAIVSTLAVGLARLTGLNEFSLGYVPASLHRQPDWFGRVFASVVPLPVRVQPEIDFVTFRSEIDRLLAESEDRVSHLIDLSARYAQIRRMTAADYPIRVVRVGELDRSIAETASSGAALTIFISEHGAKAGLLSNGQRLNPADFDRFVSSLEALLAHATENPTRPVGDLEILTAADYRQLADLSGVQEIEDPHAVSSTVHGLFELQASRAPGKVACVFQERESTYSQLNEASNRLAHFMRSEGVERGHLIGVLVSRSPEMLISLLGILKCGAAYVPLDPEYPQDRLDFMMADAGLRAVVTERKYAGLVSSAPALILEDVSPRLTKFSPLNLDVATSAADLAYVIYTSGSTGTPKGVMVEHGNVVRFFESIDERIDIEPGVWLAVTSISFDISVLELFWTLARGFTIVLHDDSGLQRAEHSRPTASQGLEFGLFYWNVASEESALERDKYRLLIEGAKFADTNGFNAVWNPERHFESFGGLFPNPSVTCAALATITSRVALRAGSCVVPLHSPIRIAEEWAVVDNLSGGRVGISIAAGWAAPDFAIRPENFADARNVMFESAEIVRRLWRGENVSFPGPQGPVDVRTLPRPIQKELPLWVTSAGNIATFIEAGRAGTNLLTHLLGQSVEEVAEKIAAYRQARADAGHPGRGVVTLMLHTFVGPSEDEVEAIVREPMKKYLESAVFLVKAAAWQFPAFRKLSDEQGRTLDQFFADISSEDMDALLEFAFQRYFRTSGLFGSPESCLAMIDRVRNADVDEIACLIDFGIATQTVLDHLPWLAQLKDASQRSPDAQASHDYSIPAMMTRHHVTHLQCTPSMARMLVADTTAAPGLASLRQMMVGGETLPPDLARSLSGVVSGRLTNMYGPTETTIWSSTAEIEKDETSAITIGRPLRGESIYILDGRQRPLPPGAVGELVIGGAGVVRGYLGRAELTAERFVDDPFTNANLRMYRTGDLARYLSDGRIEFLGRADHQVKLRGHRVELGEIESLLRNRDELSEAVVVLREDSPGDQRLVGYVVPAHGREPDFSELRTWLAGQLPSFMIPSAWVSIGELPLTPNGKLDRRALPPPLRTDLPPGKGLAPRSETEAAITEIWQRALGLPGIDVRANFFDIGGHSLLIIQVLKELREKFQRPLQMTDLFRFTTVESLARFLNEGAEDKPAIDRSRDRAAARRAAIQRRRQR
jgi:natural product biosynthesis luciferase-like monooxygenase protein